MKYSPEKLTYPLQKKSCLEDDECFLLKCFLVRGKHAFIFGGCNHRQHPSLHPSQTVPGLVGVERRIADLQSFLCHPGGVFFNPHKKGFPRSHEARVAKKNTKTQHVHPVFFKQRFLFGIFIAFSEHIHMKIERQKRRK